MNAPAAPPLVLTKLRVPAARPRVIPRARLVNLLSAENCAGLTLVCAPAGYGKTTLLTEWARALQHNGAAVAWYALDSGDDHPTVFGAYLIASLIQALGPTSELTQAAQILRASPAVELQRILPAVLNAAVLSAQPCVLVLDDYHLIRSPEILSAVSYLLDHLPENLRIVIGSRTTPPLPLARLRARGELLEVRTAHLRFNDAETAQYLTQIMRLELSPAGIQALEERTEGWAAGLQLASLALQASASAKEGESVSPSDDILAAEEQIRSFSGDHRYLAEYLLEEVVTHLPEALQWFLISTSILERMCAPLCDALYGTSEDPKHTSETILQQLEQANLFIVAIDDQREWYRYHHLFRDFLFNQLKRAMPDRIPGLHRAACEWLAAQNLLSEAARHAFETRDWEYAAAFVEQYSFSMIIHGEISTMHAWCSAFPEDVMQRHPTLCILQCWAWVFTFRRQDRERVEKRLQQADRGMAALGDPQITRDLTEHAAIVRIYLSMIPDPTADPRALLSLSNSLLKLYKDGEAGQFSALLTTGYAQMALHNAQAANQALESARQAALTGHLYLGIVEATFNLSRLAHSTGALRHAVELCRQAQADEAVLLARPEQELPALGCLDIALGCVLLEQDQLEEAEQHLRHGLDLIGWGMTPYYVMTAYLALFRLRAIQGRSLEAVDFLARLEIAWPDIAFCTRGLRAAYLLRISPQDPGALAEAASWLHSFSPSEDWPPPGVGPFGAAEVYYLAYLAWMRLQIATGHPEAARPYLGRLLNLASKHGLAARVIELTLLEAEILDAAHQPASAPLERALVMAQPEGFIHIFNQGATLTRLLIETAHRGICTERIQRILTAIRNRQEAAEVLPGAAPVTQPAGLVLPEPLSDRELEVLRLIASGATNQTIAEQLVVTVGTVKSHINHILGKLDTHNRTAAVARARELGLIEM